MNEMTTEDRAKVRKEKELLKIVTQFTKGILGKKENKRMCFAVCAPLEAYLNLIGYKVALIEGELHKGEDTYVHYWLELQDGRIIDPTASQFNEWVSNPMPDIYIGTKPEYYITAQIAIRKTR